MTIEIEPVELVEVRTGAVSDDADVVGALLDIVAPPVEDADVDPDRIALVPMPHPGEDEVTLWFG